MNRLIATLQINKPVLYGLYNKLWSFTKGPLVALCITVYFSAEVQGYYYTFTSLLGITVFVELGLGRVLIQFSSFEWAKLKINSKGKVVGPTSSISRLSSLISFGVKWYGFASIILFIASILLGFIFFNNTELIEINWQIPWVFLCILTATNILFVPLLSILEGCNFISQVYLFKLINNIITGTLLIFAIIVGANLWSSLVAPVIFLICSVVMLFIYREFFLSLLTAKKNEIIDWQKEILPMQWRVSVSWISGFFAFKLFTPILFNYYGPVLAGQMGMTWVAIKTVNSISSAWVNPRGPLFGQMIAKKNYFALDSSFKNLLGITVVISLLASILLALFIFALNYINHPLSYRLLPFKVSCLFLLGAFIHSISSPFSLYLRAHKKEPLYYLSILFAILIGITSILFGKEYGAEGIGYSYFLVNVIVFPLTVLIWFKKKKEWHV